MSGTALYRTLVHTGAPEEAPEEKAKERRISLDTLQGDISELKVMLAEIRATNRLCSGLIVVVLAFLFKLSFA